MRVDQAGLDSCVLFMCAAAAAVGNLMVWVRFAPKAGETEKRQINIPCYFYMQELAM